MFLIHFSIKSNTLTPITAEDDALHQKSGMIIPSRYCISTAEWWFFEEQLTDLYSVLLQGCKTWADDARAVYFLHFNINFDLQV